MLSADDLGDETESGGGLFLQAGFGFTPRLAIFLEGERGRDARVSVEGFDIDARSARINLGITWFLGGGR